MISSSYNFSNSFYLILLAVQQAQHHVENIKIMKLTTIPRTDNNIIVVVSNVYKFYMSEFYVANSSILFLCLFVSLHSIMPISNNIIVSFICILSLILKNICLFILNVTSKLIYDFFIFFILNYDININN